METNQNKLFAYGIQNEESHLRAHVCPIVRRIYVFPTKNGLAVLSDGIETMGYQNGVLGATASGFRVKPFDIPKCVSLQINTTAWDNIKLDKNESTSIKGQKAVRLVVAMIKAGVFPLPLGCIVDANLKKSIEIKGNDIFVWTVKDRINIQVKCDFPGGEKELGGTGFLYLQTAERNPFKYI